MERPPFDDRPPPGISAALLALTISHGIVFWFGFMLGWLL
jgi:hypothetical protein